jgi:hypothetical protein
MLIFMRTMVKLNDRLHREAKAYAAKHGTTLAALIEESLQLRLAQRGQRKIAQPIELPTYRGDGLQAGISLDDMDAVYDRMDGVR